MEKNLTTAMGNKTLKFITGNKNKFKEISAVLFPIKLKQVVIDLEEVQDLNPYKIIEEKLKQAFKHEKGNFFIEDTSGYYGALKNKLPGPYLKHFLEVLGTKGLHNMTKKLGNTKGRMHTIIVYAKDRKHIYFFEGSALGNIVSPKGGGGFGVDKIFKPKGQKLTLAQLKEKGGSEFSARNKAARKLKKFLEQNEKR